jgi:hypothetical protein
VFASTALLALATSVLSDQPECRRGGVVNTAANCPDQFAWTVFSKISRPAEQGVVWESWSTDQQTFPKAPDPSKCPGDNPSAHTCPVWDAKAGLANLNSCLDPKLPRLPRKAMPREAPAEDQPECVHRNADAFDYIVANGLWYREGLAAVFQKGSNLQFPVTSIEVKSNWKLVQGGADTSRFHTYRTPDGTVYALQSFHVSTKDLPMWFWATFEHVDNPGRCDFLGCHDSFGLAPADVPPNPVIGGAYPSGALTPALLELLRPLAPEWRHYRLKGTQVAFTDTTGAPTLLGNSVTESGFVQGSSCLTCHSKAAVQADGTSLPSAEAGVVNFGQNSVGQSDHGSPRSGWFYVDQDPIRRIALQIDFVWGPPMRAQPIGGAKPKP